MWLFERDGNSFIIDELSKPHHINRKVAKINTNDDELANQYRMRMREV
jgi:hypothetical protein